MLRGTWGDRCRRRLASGGLPFCFALIGVLFAPTLFAQEGGSREGSEPTTPTKDTTTIVSVSGIDEPVRPEMELTLEEAVRLSLRHNIDLQVQRVTEERSRRDRRIADAAFDPLFRTNYTLGRFRQPSVSFLDFGSTTSTISVNAFASDNWSMGVSGILETGTQYSVTAGGSRSDNPDSSIFSLNPRYSSSFELQVTQPLLRGFGDDSVLADVRIATRNAEISRLELRRRVEDTLVAVVNAYWDLLFARKDLEVKEQALVEANELLEINQRKLQVGNGTEFDVIDAEANIETQRAGIIDSRNTRDNAQDSLLDLINSPNYRRGGVENPLFLDVQIVPVTEPDLEDLRISLEDSVDTALNHRLEIQQQVLGIQNAEDTYQRAADDALPRFDLTGSWTNSGLEGDFSGSWDELSSGTYYDWSVGVVFEIPIGNRAARERRAQARLDRTSARLEHERTINAVVLGVTQAVRDVRSAQQRVQTTRAATRLRTEQLDGEKRRLSVGLSTSYQVLQVQNDLLEAQTAEVESVVFLLKAVTAYRRQLGDVLETFGIEVDAP